MCAVADRVDRHVAALPRGRRVDGRDRVAFERVDHMVRPVPPRLFPARYVRVDGDDAGAVSDGHLDNGEADPARADDHEGLVGGRAGDGSDHTDGGPSTRERAPAR